jgi:hypothetical protein
MREGSPDGQDSKSDVPPPMPVIAPGELKSGGPFPLHDAGDRFTIGWQGLPAREGGPSFVVLRRNPLGSIQVAERFPLTEVGWAEAWRALASRDSHSAGVVRQVLAARPDSSAARENARANERGKQERTDLEARTVAFLPRMIYLGGYCPDADMRVRNAYDVRFLRDRLAVFPPSGIRPVLAVPYPEVEDVEIGGPGAVRKGGGFVGGGFGLTGAAEGMAIAGVLNALTTRTTITTVLRVQARAAEMFLLDNAIAPDQLRIELSPALGILREAGSARPGATPGSRAPDAPSVATELVKLASLLESGLLSREEFDALKTRLIAGS